MANTSNLRPFSGANDYRRQNGRRKGSKNLSTIVEELLGANINLTGPTNDSMRNYLKTSKSPIIITKIFLGFDFECII